MTGTDWTGKLRRLLRSLATGALEVFLPCV